MILATTMHVVEKSQVDRACYRANVGLCSNILSAFPTGTMKKCMAGTPLPRNSYIWSLLEATGNVLQMESQA